MHNISSAILLISTVYTSRHTTPSFPDWIPSEASPPVLRWAIRAPDWIVRSGDLQETFLSFRANLEHWQNPSRSTTRRYYHNESRPLPVPPGESLLPAFNFPQGLKQWTPEKLVAFWRIPGRGARLGDEARDWEPSVWSSVMKYLTWELFIAHFIIAYHSSSQRFGLLSGAYSLEMKYWLRGT